MNTFNIITVSQQRSHSLEQVRSHDLTIVSLRLLCPLVSFSGLPSRSQRQILFILYHHHHAASDVRAGVSNSAISIIWPRAAVRRCFCCAVHRRSTGGGWSQRCCEHAGAVSSTQLCRCIVRLWSLQSRVANAYWCNYYMKVTRPIHVSSHQR